MNRLAHELKDKRTAVPDLDLCDYLDIVVGILTVYKIFYISIIAVVFNSVKKKPALNENRGIVLKVFS